MGSLRLVTSCCEVIFYNASMLDLVHDSCIYGRMLLLLLSGVLTLTGCSLLNQLLDAMHLAAVAQVMQQIMQMTALPLQQRLCCLQTASNLLK